MQPDKGNRALQRPGGGGGGSLHDNSGPLLVLTQLPATALPPLIEASRVSPIELVQSDLITGQWPTGRERKGEGEWIQGSVHPSVVLQKGGGSSLPNRNV